MPVTSDIARSYRAPRAVFRDHLSAGVSEGRAFAWLMGACALLFVAQFPRLAREAHLSGGEPSFAALASGALMGTVFLAPILFYALAPLGALAARAFGARPGWRAARAALFWALLEPPGARPSCGSGGWVWQRPEPPAAPARPAERDRRQDDNSARHTPGPGRPCRPRRALLSSARNPGLAARMT